jgi:hypothetical protein
MAKGRPKSLENSVRGSGPQTIARAAFSIARNRSQGLAAALAARSTNAEGEFDMKSAAITATVLAGFILASLAIPSIAAANKPEFEKAATFTSSVVGGTTVFKNPKGQEVRCTGGGIEKGEISAANTKVAKAIKFKLTGCKAGTVKCKSLGANEEEIVSEPLEGELGYLLGTAEGSETVAFALSPTMSGGLIASFTCLLLVEEKGCLAGKIKKTNTLTTLWTLTFEEKNGEQAVKDYEPTKGTVKACEFKQKVAGGGEEQNGMEATHDITLNIADKIIA